MKAGNKILNGAVFFDELDASSDEIFAAWSC